VKTGGSDTTVSFATYDTRREQYQNIPTCAIFITTLMHDGFIVINYCFDMIRSQLSAIFRELTILSTPAAYG
jgi:hypothetical protein